MTKTRDLADLGGGFIQAGSGATQRTVESKLQDVVSVKDFGAVGDGVADDTAAIQAAIDYAASESVRLNGGASIFIPNGEYLVNSTLTITDSQIDIYGEGLGSQITAGSNFGDVFLLSSVDPLTIALLKNSIRDLFIYYKAGVAANGAAVHLKNCSRVYLENLSIQGGGDDCIYVEGADSVYIANCDLQSGSRLTAATQNTSQVKIGGLWNGSTLVKPTASIYIDSCQLRADTTNTYIESSLIIGQSDGIYISSTHFGVATNNILLRPEKTNAPLEKVYVTGCYIDGNVEVCNTCLRIDDPLDGAHVNVFRLFSFSSCLFARPITAGILVNAADVQDLKFVGCEFQGGDNDNVLFNTTSGGKNAIFAGCSFTSANRSLSGTAADIRFSGGASFTDLVISGCTFGSTDAVASIACNGSENNILVTGSTFVKNISGSFSGKTIRLSNCLGLTGNLSESYGVSTISTDANAQFTIPHNLYTTPTYANLVVKGDSPAAEVEVVNVSATVITGRLHDASGADKPSSSGWVIYYEAKV